METAKRSNTAREPRTANHAFSMLEIIVVIVMIGIMLTVALPKYNRAVEKSRQAEALANLAAIRGAQMRYYAQTGSWAQGFASLDAEEPLDPQQYFSYYIVYPPAGDPLTVASAVRNNEKNCCFGAYTVYAASSGKISKASAAGFQSVP